MTPYAPLSFAVSASLALAQSGIGWQGAAPPDFAPWPTDWTVSAFAPLVDAGGRPVPRRVLAAGATDFDADGNTDLWFLGEDAGGQTQLHALMANSGDLGRFRAWAEYAPAAHRDAATYRSRTALDMVLAVDPVSDRLAHHFFVPNMTAPDPRLSGYWGRTSGWLVGVGCREIETADHDGDGHDDLLLLRDATAGSTEVVLVRMGSPFGGQPTPQTEIVVSLPGRADTLRALDFDGDGITDAAVNLPGLGVAVLRGGEKQFFGAAWLPVGSGVVDSCCGDLDGDGCEELGVVTSVGVVVLAHTAGPRLLPNGAGATVLTSARFLDLDRDGAVDVVANVANGNGLLVHPGRPAGFAPPILYGPQIPPPPGSGAVGMGLLAFDADRDGDLDLAVAMRDSGWVVLRARTVSLAPLVVETVHEGRFGESYISERLDYTLPASWLGAGIDSAEIGVYMRHPTDPGRPYVLWAHAIVPVATSGPQVLSVRMLYLVDLSKLPLLTSAYLYPQGFATSGDTLITVHGKVGRRRYESMLVFHEGRGDENKSTLGVQWKVIAAPPLPKADAQLLPF